MERVALLTSSASLAMMNMGTLHAGGMGVLCGLLHAVGPDHIATLVSFSTLLTPWAAMKVGAAWGMGHCAGIFGVAILVYLLGNLSGMHLESWEKVGDYVIGASMIIVAAYFFLQESKYLVEDADGNIVAAGCGCSPQPETGNHHHGSATSCTGCHKHHDEETDDACTEQTPLVAQVQELHDLRGRDTKGALVGFVQGMCCPMGLVQLSYLAGRGALDTLVFSLVTVAVAIMGTALLAASWASLTRADFLRAVSPTIMYRTSCFMTLALGCLWMAANYFDVLDRLNYVEGHAM